MINFYIALLLIIAGFINFIFILWKRKLWAIALGGFIGSATSLYLLYIMFFIAQTYDDNFNVLFRLVNKVLNTI